MGIYTVGVGIARQGGVEGAGSLLSTGVGSDAARLIKEYRDARDDFHTARLALESATERGRGPAIWGARRRYQKALRRFSQVGERLVRMGATQPDLLASAMNTL